MGAFGVRLTFSGVAWEGSGPIAGDSLVAVMTIVGAPTASGVIVAHARDVQTLRTQFRSGAAAPLDLTFVRGDLSWRQHRRLADERAENPASYHPVSQS